MMSGMSIGGADTLDGQDGADKLYGDGYTMLDNTVGGNDTIEGGRRAGPDRRVRLRDLQLQ